MILDLYAQLIFNISAKVIQQERTGFSSSGAGRLGYLNRPIEKKVP